MWSASNSVDCKERWAKPRYYLTIILIECLNKSLSFSGRQFYKCAQSTCSFFLWDPNDPNNPVVTNQNQGRPGGGGGGGRSNTAVTCRCGQPAPLRTVSKEGPNKGRQFYCCGNMMNGCKFFQWADEVK